ncbi:MAG: glycoside hydrolase family 97 N-terminal domain-containing protein, partial [Carboxylicivirga sp.]|nr:glycoside hydrolase family 97 N-terminal domain-containing protein [Carboxylicivirga sp.]
MKKFVLVQLLLMLGIGLFAEGLKSPNEQLELTFSLKNGKPSYQLTYKNKMVVKESHLGFELKEGKD